MRPILDKHRFGPWAVVTGSSSGIGKAIARHLGASGINVVLVARREAELKRVGAELSRDFSVEYRVVLMPGPTLTESMAKMGVDPSDMPLKPLSAERCAAEGLNALARNRATHVAGRVNRIMAKLMPRAVATSMMGAMIGKKFAHESLADSRGARRALTGK